MKTIFITGASSGIGKETAKLFQMKGWNVIATMRNPQAEKELTKLSNVKVVQCDVTEPDSIKKAVNEGIKAFGSIDVLVNNAGYYVIGPLEAATNEEINLQINTNLLGMINVTKEVVPYFREQKSGRIINLSSIAGVISVPLQSLYHATKWGMEGFSESIQYELAPFNIRVKIIEPGVIETDFFGRSMTITKNDGLTEYESYTKRVFKNILGSGNESKTNRSSPKGVAETIYKAATDNRKRLRYPTGNSKELVQIRKMLPYNIYASLTKSIMEK